MALVRETVRDDWQALTLTGARQPLSSSTDLAEVGMTYPL